MSLGNLNQYNIILASKSPRRQELLKGLDISFTVKTQDADEHYPVSLVREEIPLFLAEMKAKAFDIDMHKNDLIITADTIVWLDGAVLEKPVDYNDAFNILRKLSGRMHQVYTGVYIKTINKIVHFFDSTDVCFKVLADDEIKYYLDNYQPYDKAGAYGVQEWIGYVAVEKMVGSYFNVMGLPIQRLYEELRKF